MNTQIVIRGVDETAELRALASDKLETALARYQERVRHVTLRLEDETGPHVDRVDKVCAIELVLDSGDVHIRERSDSFPAAIDVALDRMRAAISKQISRDKRGIGEG